MKSRQVAPPAVARRPSAALPQIAYALIASPVGELLIAATDRGLVRLAFVLDGPEPVLWELVARVSPRVHERPAAVGPVRHQLGEYFAGRRRDFDTPLDWSLIGGFRRAVLEATTTVPYGKVASYAEVAQMAGRPAGARAAGGALAANPIAIVVPCHRIVRTGGGLGGYGPGLERKRYLLELEGALPAELAPSARHGSP